MKSKTRGSSKPETILGTPVLLPNGPVTTADNDDLRTGGFKTIQRGYTGQNFDWQANRVSMFRGSVPFDDRFWRYLKTDYFINRLYTLQKTETAVAVNKMPLILLF